jgi:hypothetical protein
LHQTLWKYETFTFIMNDNDWTSNHSSTL